MFEWLKKPSSKDRKERGARLKKEIKRLGLTQTKVAKDLEMSLSGLTYLLCGKSLITPTHAYAMEFKYGISSDWILYGRDIRTPVLNTSRLIEDLQEKSKEQEFGLRQVEDRIQKLEEEIKQAEWFRLGVELSNRYRERVGK